MRRGPSISRSMIGSVNAAVLPVPVCARPMRSRPALRERDRVALNRRRRRVAGVANRVEDERVEAEGLEAGDCFAGGAGFGTGACCFCLVIRATKATRGPSCRLPVGVMAPIERRPERAIESRDCTRACASSADREASHRRLAPRLAAPRSPRGPLPRSRISRAAHPAARSAAAYGRASRTSRSRVPSTDERRRPSAARASEAGSPSPRTDGRSHVNSCTSRRIARA